MTLDFLDLSQCTPRTRGLKATAGIHNRATSALLFWLNTWLVPASLRGTPQSPSQVSQTQKRDVLEKHLQFLLIGTEKGPLPFRSLLPVTQGHGCLGKRSECRGGAEWFVLVLGWCHRCWEVLAAESFCPASSSLLCGSRVSLDQTSRPCWEPASLLIPRQPRSLSPPALSPHTRGGGAPPSAGCGGGTASRGDSSSGHGCGSDRPNGTQRGKRIRAGSPAPSCLSARAVRLSFFFISVTVTRESSNVLCPSVLLIDLNPPIAPLPGLMITESLSACAWLKASTLD